MITSLKKYIKNNVDSPEIHVREECIDLRAMLLTEGTDSSDHIFSSGQAIYMTGSAGSAGTELIKRYHSELLPYELMNIQASQLRIADMLSEDDNIFRINSGERGIYQTLFDLHKISGLGFEIDVQKIPVSSSTCEITEYLGLNPFRLLASGCRIYIVSEDRIADKQERILYSELRSEPVFPVKIGHLTEDNDMKLVFADSISLLNRPGRDELLKIIDK